MVIQCRTHSAAPDSAQLLAGRRYRRAVLSVLSKPAKPDPRLVYPPYTDRALTIMRRLF